jgi:hypothetical protein
LEHVLVATGLDRDSLFGYSLQLTVDSSPELYIGQAAATY